MDQNNKVDLKTAPRIEVHKEHITAVFSLDQFSEGLSIGIMFHAPKEVLEFSTRLMEAASKCWPENEFVTEYQNEIK